MADVSVDPQSTNSEELVNAGVKAFILNDYNAAITALSRAIELMVKEHGETGDALGTVYLYYGKALLEISRENAEPLGDAVARELDSDSDEDESEAADPEKVTSSEADKSKVEAKTDETKPESMNGSNESKPGCGESSEKEAGDNKNGESKKENEKNEGSDEAQASSTTDKPSNSGIESKETADGENTTENAEEEPTDLQLAWEILELAKLIFVNRDDVGKKELAETLVTLGEVSMEGESFESAIADIKQGLEIQKQVLDPDSRVLAQTYYKLAVALSNNNQFDEAVENFGVSLNVLKTRIENLKKNEEESNDEIKDIESLIPEIEEKIADTKSCKEEATNKVAAVLGEKKELSSDGAGSSSKQVNDISHLVKRKRKLEDIVEECEANNPNKKNNTV